jgi:hypothetical protein
MRPEIESQRLLPALFQRYFDANSLETGSSGLPGEPNFLVRKLSPRYFTTVSPSTGLLAPSGWLRHGLRVPLQIRRI